MRHNRAKYLEVAERVLQKHRRPLRARELVNYGIEDGFVPNGWLSKTPQKSMQARLSIEILSNGERSKFVRTGPGEFYLRHLLAVPQSALQDSKAPPIKPYESLRRRPPPSKENVIAIPASHYQNFLSFQGFKKIDEKELTALLDPEQIEYLPRLEAEEAEGYKHVVTYVMVTNGSKVLNFRRGSYNRVASFLRGSRCIGFGGHVAESDVSLFSAHDLGVSENAVRELSEEIDIPPHALTTDAGNLQLVGLINDDSSSVGRRHVAVVYKFEVKDESSWTNPKKGESSINKIAWIDTEKDKINLNEFEYWSHLCWRHFYPNVIEAQPAFKIIRKKRFREAHIISVIGTIGSGKSSATSFFNRKLGYQTINSGQILSKILDIPPVPHTPRDKFQEHAERFISSSDGPRVLAKEIAHAAKRYDVPRLIVDGIRHLETLRYLRQYAHVDVPVLYIHTDPDIAYELYKSREAPQSTDFTVESFMKLYTAKVEANVAYLIDEADAIVFNWSGKDQYGQTLEALAEELRLGRKRNI